MTFRLVSSKEQAEIVKWKNGQIYDQQKETKDKYSTHNTTLKTKARVQRIIQKLGWLLVFWKGKNKNNYN